MVKTIDTTFPHDDVYARGRMKLGLGLVMLAPGIPAMLMGDEWLEDTDFGASSGTRIDWSKKTTYASHFAFAKALIGMRRTLGPLFAGAAATVHHLNEAGNVVGFWRSDAAGNRVLVVANFSNASYPSYRVGVPTGGHWTELLNSESAAYGGAGGDNPDELSSEAVPADAQPQSLVLSLPARAIAVLLPVLMTGVGDRPGAGAARPSLAFLSPVPSRSGATLAFALPGAGEAALDLFDAGGRRIARLAAGRFEAGRHVARWDGRDEAGREAAPGLYLVRLASGSGTAVRKLPVIR
jgi:hypothetical protein